MRERTLIYALLAAGLVLTVASCCKDDDNGKPKGRSTAVFNPGKTYGSVKDIDGNEYKTITIGTQTWMAENLRVTSYRNGDPIPNVKGETDIWEWGNLKTGACCSYRNTTNPDSMATFGLLYNWYAATDPRGVAPEGWHVPTDAEWDTLINYVAAGDAITNMYGNSIAGGRMKETGTLHWGFPNRFASNSSGFTAIPGGFRSTYKGDFLYIGYNCHYWSVSEYVATVAFNRLMNTDFATITRGCSHGSDGLSVRCIKE
jgi:uncharacterized protein (TIGR02145 family)